MYLKRYSKEFKINAVRQYLQTDKSKQSIMNELAISDRKTFSDCVKEYKSKGDQAFDKEARASKKNLASLTREEKIIILGAQN